MTEAHKSPITLSNALALSLVLLGGLAMSFQEGSFIQPPVVLVIAGALAWIFRPRRQD